MPLTHYGVLSGTLKSHQRDSPDNMGQWYHVHLIVQVGTVSYDCAIDVDSHQSSTGVEWATVPVDVSDFAAVQAMGTGYHELSHTATSGAFDAIRSRLMHPRLGCLFVIMPNALVRLLMTILQALIQPRWTQGSHVEATAALESILTVGQRVWVYGEPFTNGNGQHNVHQNQGDPVGSQWWAENGIWQDGAIITEKAGGGLMMFVSKFTSQSYQTDDQGHPI
jgi:hypothetical protein